MGADEVLVTLTRILTVPPTSRLMPRPSRLAARWSSLPAARPRLMSRSAKSAYME